MFNDAEYFLSRAAEEEARAAEADDEAAQGAHRQLAEFYRQVATRHAPRPLHDYQIGNSELFIF